MRDRVFLTGGTGFIGRRLLTCLAGRRPERPVFCLARPPSTLVRSAGVEVVIGDLREPATYMSALSETDLVLHLAAVTGKARASEYFAVNVDGTRDLLAACRGSGVRKFVFVSSIAATYRDKTAYFYAQSKEIAEQAVRDSGLNYLIVRPTLVLGQGSPIWNKLATLARLPVMPIFGDGSVRVQPICVDDVATFLSATLQEPTLPDEAIDLGGPEVVTFEDLLRRIRRALIGRDSPAIHLPVRQAMAVLASVERWFAPLLPFTAGQLSAFVNDSVAAADPIVARSVPHMRSIDEMLQRMTAHG